MSWAHGIPHSWTRPLLLNEPSTWTFHLVSPTLTFVLHSDLFMINNPLEKMPSYLGPWCLEAGREIRERTLMHHEMGRRLFLDGGGGRTHLCRVLALLELWGRKDGRHASAPARESMASMPGPWKVVFVTWMRRAAWVTDISLLTDSTRKRPQTHTLVFKHGQSFHL